MPKLSIGISGHIDLIHGDFNFIKKRIKEKIEKITKGLLPSDVVLYTGMAKGADSLTAEVALDLGIRVVAVRSILNKDEPLPNGIEKKVLPNHFLENEAQLYYVVLGDFLVQNSDHLLVLWDGIYNGKKGGTSEVVLKALNSQRKFSLHQLVVPRKQNPYPLANLLKESLNFRNEKFQRIPFTVHFSWIELVLPLEKKESLVKKWLRISLHFLKSKIFLSFCLPIILVVLTISLGALGFSEISPWITNENAFYKAVNLLTLSESVIISPKNLPTSLQVARLLGLITTMSAFAIAFFLALGNEWKRVRLSIFRLIYKARYTLVIGSGEKSFDLIKDLSQAGKKIVWLVSTDSVLFAEEVDRMGVILIKGQSHSEDTLKKVHYQSANEIFLMDDDDTKNIRGALELDRLTPSGSLKQKWYVHIQSKSQRQLLTTHIRKEFWANIHVFDTNENTARRLQLYYPFDRFYQSPDTNTTHVVVFGFGKLAQEIVLSALRLGHFPYGKRLKVSVFCKNANEEKIQFESHYPALNPHASSQYHLNLLKENLWEDESLSFHELPNADSELLSNQNLLFTQILKEKHIVSLYVCLENGFESGEILSVLLPKLNFIKTQRNCNLQVFCFYNFPDKNEEKATEYRFNCLAPDIPVVCFGNLLDECSAVAIRDRALDALPKQIAYWYIKKYGDSSLNIEQAWLLTSEQEKESNRNAADHLWIKIRSIWHIIDWKFNPKTFELLPDVVITPENELPLCETEHRRWCAELLLKGFRSLQDAGLTMEEIEDLRELWYKPGGKDLLKAQKLHIDLLPFEDIEPSEQEKDLNQIRNIPKFLKAIINTE
tara:strand:+ start:34267 stop:36756 length:2490 start_codon:yes stop_codon:yes gene_type:complete